MSARDDLLLYMNTRRACRDSEDLHTAQTAISRVRAALAPYPASDFVRKSAIIAALDGETK